MAVETNILESWKENQSDLLCQGKQKIMSMARERVDDGVSKLENKGKELMRGIKS